MGHIMVAGEIEEVSTYREDGEKYVVIHTDESPDPIRLSPTRRGWRSLERALDRTRPADGAFSEDPPKDQTSLSEIDGGVVAAEGSDVKDSVARALSDDDWFGEIEIEIAADETRAKLAEEKPDLGDVINPSDPTEW